MKQQRVTGRSFKCTLSHINPVVLEFNVVFQLEFIDKQVYFQKSHTMSSKF